MKSWRIIDFGAREYRRVICKILESSADDNWVRIEQGGKLYINFHSLLELPADANSYELIHYFGIESDADIQRILERESAHRLRDHVFIVKIRRDNLYCFSTAILDRATVLFILDYVPTSLEERLHAFNLFHKSLLLRRVGSLLYYNSQVVNMLTTSGSLPAFPPDLRDALGLNSILYQFAVFRDRVWMKFDLWSRRSKRRALANASASNGKALKNCRHAIITGWYGTETAGDKAILQELVHVLREQIPEIKISITSIFPGLSRLTNLELGIDAEILELRDLDYRTLNSVDLVVFGGGPLMDSSQLKYIEVLFEWAHRRGIATLIFGCGVGPLKTNLGIERAKSILGNSRHAFFRDERSANLAKELGYCGPKLFGCDPAMRYAARWREQRMDPTKFNPGEELVALLRSQTSEYSSSASAETDRLREEVSAFFVDFLEESGNREIAMLPMHTFWVGNDDREYIRQVAETLPRATRLVALNETLLLDNLLERVASADWGLPMRFHGHIFMLALGVPFVSINYTGTGGKVSSLIKRYRLEDYSVSVAGGINSGEIQLRWDEMRSHVDQIRAHMEKQVETDLKRLEDIYESLFSESTGQTQI